MDATMAPSSPEKAPWRHHLLELFHHHSFFEPLFLLANLPLCERKKLNLCLPISSPAMNNSAPRR
jgi:hypothetical protein